MRFPMMSKTTDPPRTSHHSKGKNNKWIRSFVIIGCWSCLATMFAHKSIAVSVSSQFQEGEWLPIRQRQQQQHLNYPRIEFNPDRPIFSLSLPHTGMSILPRYFKCGNYARTFSRYWSPHTKPRKPMGRCMMQNMRHLNSKYQRVTDYNSNPPNLLEGCGKYSIWHELQYREAPSQKQNYIQGRCFDPILYPGSLEQLHIARPNATIVLQIVEPKEWYESLSYDLHDQWTTWCNPTHDNVFPTERTEEAYLRFYERYHNTLRHFVNSHHGWNLIELNLANSTSHAAIGARLQQQLGIASKCWMESVTGNIPQFDNGATNITNNGDKRITEPTKPSLIPLRHRPNDITYPILVVSLPKSGTTTIHNYFQCNLGMHFSKHQWINKSHTIGDCMLENTQNNLPILQNCVHGARVFTDIGVYQLRKRCYYPQLNRDGLELFAQAYPRATIMMAVRNSTQWVTSASKYRNLKRRWAKGQNRSGCPGLFPSPNAEDGEWVEFYERHTRKVREFARGHPALTYVEIPLNDEIGNVVDDIFGFTKRCWGHTNVNEENMGD